MSPTNSIVNESLLLKLPDKAFFDLCHELFGINRGVYNVIDHWFYHHGYQDIESRRDTILSFLDYLRKHKIYKFGKGGVKHNLELFTTNQKEKEVG
jgi:riboflavin kinase